jgi:hypothetical protein
MLHGSTPAEMSPCPWRGPSCKMPTSKVLIWKEPTSEKPTSEEPTLKEPTLKEPVWKELTSQTSS